MSSTDPYLIKLVRDDVEASMENPQHGIIYKTIEDRMQFIEWLRRKLGEEMVEYLIKPSSGELADILEVVAALARHDLHLSVAQVMDEANRKREARGGFDLGMAMWAVPVDVLQ